MGQLIRAIFEKLEVRGLKSNFEEINLCDNKIGDEGAKYLADGLTGNKALKKLYLARCDMGAESFEHMGRLLADAPALEDLVLSHNACDKDGLEGAFCDGLHKNKTLKSLYLGVLRLGNEGIKPLCEAPLRVHPSLQHLSLTYNRIDAAGVNYLNAVLKVNKALKYLDLSGNSLGPDGAAALVSGLKMNKGLQKLSVAQNMIRFEGAKALGQFFVSAEGKRFEFMDLRHNSVTFKGYIEMGKLLGRPDASEEIGAWLWLFGSRQLFISAH